MKKYLVALIPLVVCYILSFATSNMTPTDFPDPTYPYRTEVVLEYLTSMWLLIGIVLSIVFLFIICIHDIFSKLEKWLEYRRNRTY